MESNANKANTTQQQRNFFLEIMGKKLNFTQKSSQSFDLGTGTVVWDAGKVLAKYLETQPPSLGQQNQKRILELGAGTGVVGICLASYYIQRNTTLPKQVVLTDLPQILGLIETNATSNLPSECFSHLRNNNNDNDNNIVNNNIDVGDEINIVKEEKEVKRMPQVDVKEFAWGDDVTPLQPPFDIIVGADVVFKERFVQPLLQSLSLLSTSATEIYICMEIRDEALYESFQEQAAQLFNIKKIPMKKLHREYRSEYVAVFQLNKKRSD